MSRKAVYLPDSARRILISSNPLAGARSRQHVVARLAAKLDAEGFQTETVTDLGELAAAATELHERGLLRALVAAGGDGTVAELVNRTPPDVPIAVLPLGNENLLAKYIGSPHTPEALASTIAQGLTVRLDAGRAGRRVFLLMISAGFDAQVVHQVHAARTGHIGPWTYAKPIFQTIRSYQYPEMRIYCRAEASDNPGSARQPITTQWVMVVNLPRYARGLRFTPQAVGTDGLLDVCTFEHNSFVSGLRYLINVLLGRHQRLPGCTTLRCDAVRIEADQPVPYQLDGDPGGHLPVDVEVVPERLRMVIPRRAAETCGFQLPDAHAAGKPLNYLGKKRFRA